MIEHSHEWLCYLIRPRAAAWVRIACMQGVLGVIRIGARCATVVLAVGVVMQALSVDTPGLAGAQRAAPLLGRFAQDTIKRPRITGIDHVRLYVSDFKNATTAALSVSLKPRCCILGSTSADGKSPPRL